MEKDILNQLEGWEYKNLNGLDVLVSYDKENSRIGIELHIDPKTQKVNSVKGFVMENDEREYEVSKFTDEHYAALSIVEGFYYGNIGPVPIEPTESIEPITTKESIPVVRTPTKQFFTEVLTEDQLIASHPGSMTVLVNLQTTDPMYIKERPGRGGKVKYVEGNYIIRALNLAFLFDWSFHIMDAREEDNEVSILGKLVIQMNGKTITKTQYGNHDIIFKKGTKEPLSLSNDYKGAATDSLKKCASQLGIAQDVYSA